LADTPAESNAHRSSDQSDQAVANDSQEAASAAAEPELASGAVEDHAVRDEGTAPSGDGVPDQETQESAPVEPIVQADADNVEPPVEQAAPEPVGESHETPVEDPAAPVASDEPVAAPESEAEVRELTPGGADTSPINYEALLARCLDDAALAD